MVHQVIFNLAVHAGAEEQLVYPMTREAFGDARMIELGPQPLAKEKSAPTRPHSPSNPVVAAPAALVDKMRNKAADVTQPRPRTRRGSWTPTRRRSSASWPRSTSSRRA